MGNGRSFSCCFPPATSAEGLDRDQVDAPLSAEANAQLGDVVCSWYCCLFSRGADENYGKEIRKRQTRTKEKHACEQQQQRQQQQQQQQQRDCHH